MNMDNCKFENTVEDLEQCLNALNNGRKIYSKYEYGSALRLIALCREMNRYDKYYIESLVDLSED